MITQERIYSYFEREPELKVLFIFDRMAAISSELTDADWPDDYVYKEFDGKWFTLKYQVATEWKAKRVILLFPEEIRPVTAELRQEFQLLDVLVANNEFRQDNWEEYMQRYSLPSTVAKFVRENIQELMTAKLSTILAPYLQGDDFSEDKGIRGLISSYLGEKKLLDWETIFIKMMILDLPSESKKHIDFYWRINRNKTVLDKINVVLTKIFGFSFSGAKETKMQQIAESLKYNAITQTLSAVGGDTYKSLKITEPLSIEWINRIYDRGLNDMQLRDRFNEAMGILASQIREEEIINVYGTDVPYYYFTEALCMPIFKRVANGMLVEDPEKAIERIRELSLRLATDSPLIGAVNFIETAGAFNLNVKNLGAMQFTTPGEYISFYTERFSMVDRLYREVVRMSRPTQLPSEFEETAGHIKHLIDLDYARITNVLNLGWMSVINSTEGGFDATGLKKQDSFFRDNYDSSIKKLVVIVSDALRYEMAQELMDMMAGTKHVARLSPMLAMLPTETKYCKPALLPHNKLSLTGDNMTVDGKVLTTKEDRQALLQSYYPYAVCLNYEEIMDGSTVMSKRDLFKGNPLLVYIFHNTIDNAGHDGDVATACHRALNELKDLVEKLHASWNVVNVIVTSDHGFLYNDIPFEAKDKHSITEVSIEKKTRYYLTPSHGKIEGVSKFPLNKVSGISTTELIEVVVPDGTNRFAAPGGYQFAHGGASLQEMIVPVIYSRQQRSDKTEKVGVALMDHNLILVSSRLKLRLIQSDPVTMTRTERTVVCQVFDGDNPVTEPKSVKLTSTDATNLNNRLYEISLRQTVTDARSTLQLRIWDKDEPLNPLVTETVKNNTILEQDF